MRTSNFRHETPLPSSSSGLTRGSKIKPARNEVCAWILGSEAEDDDGRGRTMMRAKADCVEGGVEDDKSAVGTRMSFRIKCLVAAVLALAVMVLSGCDMLGFRSWFWHQKLTVTVETPDGPRSGSAVSAGRFQTTPKWAGVGDSAGASNSYLSGEAVVVDLGEGRANFRETNCSFPPDFRVARRHVRCSCSGCNGVWFA
jgi:hypothetical protein